MKLLLTNDRYDPIKYLTRGETKRESDALARGNLDRKLESKMSDRTIIEGQAYSQWIEARDAEWEARNLSITSLDTLTLSEVVALPPEALADLQAEIAEAAKTLALRKGMLDMALLQKYGNL